MSYITSCAVGVELWEIQNWKHSGANTVSCSDQAGVNILDLELVHSRAWLCSMKACTISRCFLRFTDPLAISVASHIDRKHPFDRADRVILVVFHAKVME